MVGGGVGQWGARGGMLLFAALASPSPSPKICTVRAPTQRQPSAASAPAAAPADAAPSRAPPTHVQVRIPPQGLLRRPQHQLLPGSLGDRGRAGRANWNAAYEHRHLPAQSVAQRLQAGPQSVGGGRKRQPGLDWAACESGAPGRPSRAGQTMPHPLLSARVAQLCLVAPHAECHLGAPKCAPFPSGHPIKVGGRDGGRPPPPVMFDKVAEMEDFIPTTTYKTNARKPCQANTQTY